MTLSMRNLLSFLYLLCCYSCYIFSHCQEACKFCLGNHRSATCESRNDAPKRINCIRANEMGTNYNTSHLSTNERCLARRYHIYNLKQVLLKKLISKKVKVSDEKEFFTIYSPKISECKGKINDLNNKLTTSSFDIICIQESWLDDSINDNEITGGTQFSIVRADRSFFNNPRKRGGGVCILIKDNFLY